MPLAHPSPAAAHEAEVVLRDGSTVHLRSVLPGDEPALRRFFEALSPESRHLRFFTGAPDLGGAARAAVEQATSGDIGLLATRGGAIVAHAICASIDEGRAEVAFAVAEELHGEGLATLLLLRLAEAAAERGIGVLVADVLPANREMLAVFRDSGLATARHSEPGMVVVECATELGPEARARFERRGDDAAAAAVAHVLRPASVAVIGASDKPGTVGFQVLQNLRTGFRGRLHAVNPRASSLDGLPCHPSVLAVPGDVELAVIAVPAEAVPGVAQECAAKGVRALVVLSAGFAETSGAGGRRQQVLLDICRASGMRLVGPNCLGVLNAAPDVGLDATFAPVRPSHGHVGFLSQSGALAIAALAEARERGIGLSSIVSIGDKADLSGNDLLRWWEHDPDTSVVLLYLESFGNPRAFRHIARRVGRTKPIVALKAGRTPAGSRAASSHTGALLAASDVGVDALFAQAGVIRSETAAELFDVGRRCSPTSPCRPGTASRSSRTPGARPSSAPTPAWPAACASTSSRPARGGGWPRSCPRPPPWRTRST